MAYNPELADRMREALHGRQGFTEKKMFGGIAFMLNGNMCCGVANDDLMLRVGPQGYEAALDQPHARLMDFTGRPMKGFVFVGPDGLGDDDALEGWLQRGIAFVQSLPVK